MNHRAFTISSILLLSLFSKLGFSEPPRKVPAELYDEFTLNGTIPIYEFYRDDSYTPEKPLVYEFNEVEHYIKKINRKCQSYYGITDTYLYEALDAHIGNFKGKEVGILGSTIPWYEAVVIAYGGIPITIEYNKIVSHHPKIHTMTVEEYNKSPRKFDYILSISSFEHDGLARYGDPINPNGDLEAMKKTMKMLNPDGILFLAVPIEKDILCWNIHRSYGRIRTPMLLEGWEVIDSFGFDEKAFDADPINGAFPGSHQPVFVLKPKDL